MGCGPISLHTLTPPTQGPTHSAEEWLWPGFKFWLCHILAACLWTSDLPLCSVFLTVKWKQQQCLSLKVLMRINEFTLKSMHTASAHKGWLLL